MTSSLESSGSCSVPLGYNNYTPILPRQRFRAAIPTLSSSGYNMHREYHVGHHPSSSQGSHASAYIGLFPSFLQLASRDASMSTCKVQIASLPRGAAGFRNALKSPSFTLMLWESNRWMNSSGRRDETRKGYSRDRCCNMGSMHVPAPKLAAAGLIPTLLAL